MFWRKQHIPLQKKYSMWLKKKERDIVFEKKHHAYMRFMQMLKEVFAEWKNAGNGYQKNRQLESNLLFELSLLQILAPAETMNDVLDKVLRTLQLTKTFESDTKVNNFNNMTDNFCELSETFFEIAHVFQQDLYQSRALECANSRKINMVLRECGFFQTDYKNETILVHQLFWDKLQKGLRSIGHTFDMHDFSHQINEYCSSNGDSSAKYGFGFPIYSDRNGRKVWFYVEIDKSYGYGFFYEDLPKSDQKISSLILEVSNSFVCNDEWAGWKNSDNNNIDFWNINSKGYNALRNFETSELYMQCIVEEMHMYIQKFQQLARERKL